MSISRSRFLLALVASSMLAAPAFAEELAKTVAAKLKESGALAGYRVNVKAKSGTVWLEGTVSDEKQLAAAIGVAEATAGVERVVNRLVVEPQQAPPAATPLGMPATAWTAAGVAAPIQPEESAALSAVGQPPAAEKKASRNPFAAMAETLFFKQPADEQPADQVQLVQATAPTGRGRQGPGRGPAAGRAPAGRPPLALQNQGGRRMPSPAGGPAGSRMAMRTSGPGETLNLPAPGGFEGAVGDGQIVPGTMRYSEGVPSNAVLGNGVPMAGGPMAGGPVPMGTTGVGMPPVPMRGDGPNMPNYAWPSYAAYPNYAALQYPTQYSPTAWPYIGPFYPYPQVPLGWRRVSLEWDDGWWFLDFDERHYHSHHH